MTPEQRSEELVFESPGPGSWRLDPVHFPRPVTRYYAEVGPAPFARGTADFFAYYGLLIGAMETSYVNGFSYTSMKPVAEEEVQKRFERAEKVFADKLWRNQLSDWDTRLKPAAVAAHRAIQSVDPLELEDQDLISHLERCRAHHAAMIYQHMSLTGAAVLPIGDLLAHVVGWTGLPPARLLAMTRGAAPVSAGASAQLDRLIATVRQDPAAKQILESGDEPAKTLDALCALDSDSGRALSEYLAFAGYRLLDGFDISGRYALELPDALLRAIRSSVAGRSTEGSDVEDQIAEIRGQVPDQHRTQFNELVDEARLTYRIRDERGVFSDIWASGLMRRAVMAGGRRLADRGLVLDPEHFVDAGFEEMRDLLSGAGGPSADSLAARYEFRTSHSAKEAPAFLGPPPPPPPEPGGLPPAAGRAMQAMGVAFGELFESSQAPHDEQVIRGLAASGGVYEGPVRRVSGPSEFDRIVSGDVLVTESTSEAFNILLPLLGAIVTDSGGLLSHSAIVAREYGIPGVVGTRDATAHLTEKMIVRVDGDAGEVTVQP
ncbi:MAG: PEP-utilizing enzyme [Acidimicrobiales bacterium]